MNTFFSISLSMVTLCSVAGAEVITYQNPVIPGDYPDPAVIRVGDDFYATATTSEWAPIFPILHSRDLVNWSNIGAVFDRRPDWSVGNYWAPEIAEFDGKFFVYYVARAKGGPLSIAVATADRVEGPYKDHGPMIGQPAGSIDAVPVEDVDGKRYLIWKEDGNSRKQPTPLWIQQLSKDGTELVGEMKELFRNDVPWEGNVIEGPFVVRKDGYFYLFYSGNACCGRDCHYGLGVARAQNLLGPWEKNPRNPILMDNEVWKCPGHGSIVRDQKGGYYLMYHAYHSSDFVYVGRQALLDKVEFDSSGWPVINQGKGGAFEAPSPFGKRTEHKQFVFADEFIAPKLDTEWQWPQQMEPRYKVFPNESGVLELRPDRARGNDIVGGVLGIKTTSGSYVASTVLRKDRWVNGTLAGLAAYGDHDNAIGVATDGERLHLWRRGQKKHEILHSRDLARKDKLFLRLASEAGHKLKFFVSDDGQTWTHVASEPALEGNYLPPWDRGIRVALTVGGTPEAVATFESMQIRFDPPKLKP